MASERAHHQTEGFFTNEGWFFLGDKYANDFNQALGNYSVAESHAPEWVEVALHISGMCQRRKIPCIFLIAPAKWSVYREKLAGLPDFRPQQKSVLDQIVKASANTPLDLLDLRHQMIMGRQLADTYSPRDSHWNGYGAFLAWQNLASRLQEYFPGSDFFNPGDLITVETANDWDEASNLTGIPGENRFHYPIFSKQPADFDMRYLDGGWSAQGGSRLVNVGELPVNTRNKFSTSNLRALILRDSVGDLLSPYLHSSFAETYQRVHHVNVDGRCPSVSALLRDYAPDVLIFMITERYLIYPLFDLEMARACTGYELRQARLARWPSMADALGLEVAGWENPKQPVLVTFPPSSAREKFLKISIYTPGTGALLVSYTAAGDVVQRQFIYRAGASDFYLTLSGDVEGNHLWLLDQHNCEQVFLREIVLSH